MRAGNAGIKPGAKKRHGRFLYRVIPSLLREAWTLLPPIQRKR